MPRFNFSSYISKNSLTDFSVLHDLDPQADWEEKQKKDVAEGKRVASRTSTTSSEIDRQLAFEVNALTEITHTLSNSSIGRSDEYFCEAEKRVVFSSSPKELDSGLRKLDDSKLERNQLEEAYTVTTSNSMGTNQSAATNKGGTSEKEVTQSSNPNENERRSTTSPTPNMATRETYVSAPSSPGRPYSSDAATPSSSENKRRSTNSPTPNVATRETHATAPSSPGRAPDAATPQGKQTKRSATISTQVNYNPVTPPKPNLTSAGYQDEPVIEATFKRDVQKKPIKYSNDGNEQLGPATAVMFLDNNNMLHPVRHTDNIKNLVRDIQARALSPAPYAIEEALLRLQKIPFEQITHFAHLGDYVRHLQANERICDVTVHVGTDKFAAHRICLACYSDYFADIFYSRSDKQRVPLTVRLKGIKPLAFEILLRYIYTGVLDIRSEIIGDLMTMAESLRIPMVKTRVVDHLESLPLATALSILMKDKIFGPMYEKAMIAVSEQFNTFRLEDVFLEIDIETLIILLSADNLNITSELDVFKSAIRWIAHNMMHRKQYLVRLMKCVRFCYMTHLELFQCNELTDLIKFNSECIQMILEANWISTARLLCKEDHFNLPVPQPRISTATVPLPENDVFHSSHFLGEMDVEVNSPVETPRNATNNQSNSASPTDIIVVGGFNPPSSRAAVMAKSIDRYHTYENEWKHHCDLPEPRLHSSVAILHNKLYLTGGLDPRIKVKYPVPTNDAFVYDIKCNAWMKIMPMNTARMYHSLIAIYGMIYAIGGQDANNRALNTVECYNPMTDNWFFVKPMSNARLGAQVGVLDGKLFVVGGYGENIGKNSALPILDTVECFDPRVNKWKAKNNLRFARCHGNMVTVDGKLYLCGGATRSYSALDSVITSTPSIDVYNQEQDVWEHCTDMVVARHDAGTAAVGNLIYIIGGASTQSNRILRSVECFDTASKMWIPGVQDLPYPSKWIRCLSVNFN